MKKIMKEKKKKTEMSVAMNDFFWILGRMAIKFSTT